MNQTISCYTNNKEIDHNSPFLWEAVKWMFIHLIDSKMQTSHWHLEDIY